VLDQNIPDNTMLNKTLLNKDFTRKIRSFVLRQGRLTSGQTHALTHYWEKYGIECITEKDAACLDFQQIFARSAPITLEIGFGNGNSLAEMARNAPERDFIGIEVHRPGVGHLLHLIEQYQLSNVRVIRDDAVEVLKYAIPAHSLDCVQLFFPDPWHKRKHHKRRIVQAEFVSLLASRLHTNGSFHMATDWEHYAKHMAKVMQAHPDFSNTAEQIYVERPAHRPQTKFEKRGLDRGHGVWDLIYNKEQ